MMNKKGAGGGGSGLQGFYDNWPEVFFVIMLVVGFIISLVSISKYVDYLIIFFAGIIVGRLWFQKRHGQQFPLFLISVGFLLGMILGAIVSDSGTRWGVIFAFYLVGILISISIHKRGLV
jgi:hypothetical protein